MSFEILCSIKLFLYNYYNIIIVKFIYIRNVILLHFIKMHYFFYIEENKEQKMYDKSSKIAVLGAGILHFNYF